MKKHNRLKGLFVALLSLIMVLGTCTAAFADEAAPTLPAAITATYSAADDSVTSRTKGVIYVVKGATDNKIKASDTCYEIAASGKVALNDMKCKSTTKDVYLYVCASACEADFDNVSANLVIKAQAAKKVVGSIDYTQADNATSTSVLSATATDAEQKAIANPVIIWSAEQEGTYAVATTFTGKNLADMLAAGGKIFIKMQGVDGGTGTAVRTSKVYSVKVAKQAKAPNVKLDVKKSSIALGNGFDFALVTKSGETYSVPSTWYTILPYLKDATGVKTVDASLIATTTFTPLGKKEDTAKTSNTAYTAAKIKALGLDALADKLGEDAELSDGFSIAVRKSATDTKPASAVAYIDIQAQKGAPQMYTLENTSSYTVIASDAQFSLKAGKIVNNTSAWDAAKIGKDAAPAANATVDDAAAKYEMAVVKFGDIANIDWTTVGWKSIKEGTKITDKTKTKYCRKNSTTKVEATLKKIAGEAPASGDTVLLVRRAGVKGKTASASILASECLTTYVKYDSTAKIYYWEILTSTDQKLVGGDAYSYTVTYLTWDETTNKFANDAKNFPAKKYYAAFANDAKFDLPVIEGYTVDTKAENIVEATFAVNKFTVPKPENKDANVDVKIQLKKATKITIKYVVPTGHDAIADVELTDAFLGYKYIIPTDKLTNDNYEATVTGATTGGEVTPKTDNTVVTVTFTAKSAG